MKREGIYTYRYVIQDIAIFEMLNPDKHIWEYYVARKNVADLQFVFAVENRFEPEMLRELWKNGYFEELETFEI
jgi:hypothetical protein